MDDFLVTISGLALLTLHLIVDNFLWSVLWVSLSGVLAHVAGTRGRCRTGWFLWSLLLLSPVISLIILLALPNLRRERIEDERHQEILQALANIDASAPATELSNSVCGRERRGLAPERFHEAIETIGLTKESAHSFLGVDNRMINRWWSGQYDIPHSVELLLELMIALGLKAERVEKLTRIADK
jgi:hypothetical protein